MDKYELHAAYQQSYHEISDTVVYAFFPGSAIHLRTSEYDLYLSPGCTARGSLETLQVEIGKQYDAREKGIDGCTSAVPAQLMPNRSPDRIV